MSDAGMVDGVTQAALQVVNQNQRAVESLAAMEEMNNILSNRANGVGFANTRAA